MIFPSDLPSVEWLEFRAEGFQREVAGVIYDQDHPTCCGIPLGGIGTGCIDIDVSGTMGFSSIFAGYPRRSKLHAPFLGLSVGSEVVLMATDEILEGGVVESCRDPGRDPYYPWGAFGDAQSWCVDLAPIEGVKAVDNVKYWGHYPVADIEYRFDSPVSVGLRAWSPFIPGDIRSSNIPGAVFEVKLRNLTKSVQNGSVIFDFAGPDREEARASRFSRKRVDGAFDGIVVESARGVGYALGVEQGQRARFGAALGANGDAWRSAGRELPQPVREESSDAWSDSGSSLAIDFSLNPFEEKSIPIVLAWWSPVWNGNPGNDYHKMYESRFSSVTEVAQLLARDHLSLLKRIIAWQEEIYASDEFPVWLRDSLVNNLCSIPECSYWAQARPPLGDWVDPRWGLYGMIECPRACPQIECIPCSWYGNIPIVYFFPELVYTTLKGYKAYMNHSGAAPFCFGPRTEMTAEEHAWENQIALNNFCFVDMVDRMWLASGDDDILNEFYPYVKKCIIYNLEIRPYEYGVIHMPIRGSSTEWWEGWRWAGLTTHAGSLNTAGLLIAERMAEKVGDQEFAAQCKQWYELSSSVMESLLWNHDGYYKLLFDPGEAVVDGTWEHPAQVPNWDATELSNRSDGGPTAVMSNQLDAVWVTKYHGLKSVLREERIRLSLATIERTCMVDVGAVAFAELNGHQYLDAYGNFVPEMIILAMTYIYQGDKEAGLDLARRTMENLVLRQRIPFDLPNQIKCSTGERSFGTDYYQNLILWALPTALEGLDISEVNREGSFIDRIIRAGQRQE